MTTTEILTKARDLLEQGWCQGVEWIHNKNGGFSCCILGALQEAEGNHDTRFDVYDFVYGALSRLHYEKDIADFNDAPGRTQAEVLKVMDDAINQAKSATSIPLAPAMTPKTNPSP